jgi:hypothetical protein
VACLGRGRREEGGGRREEGGGRKEVRREVRGGLPWVGFVLVQLAVVSGWIVDREWMDSGWIVDG